MGVMELLMSSSLQGERLSRTLSRRIAPVRIDVPCLSVSLQGASAGGRASRVPVF